MAAMNCEICERQHHDSRLPFICAVDARNVCYQGRLQFLQVVLDSEEMQAKIKSHMAAEFRSDDGDDAARKWADMDVPSGRKAVEHRTSKVMAEAEKLRSDLLAGQDQLKKLKEDVSSRRATLTAWKAEFASTRRKSQRNMTLPTQEWDQVAETTTGTRAFLCMEAAKLYGLRRVRKGSSRFEYWLGGIEIVHLTAMNSMSPELISTSLAHVAHILMLTSQYLSVRLPAEMITPRRDHARPTIYTLASSYQSGTANSGNTVLEATLGAGSDTTPRPRRLFIEKALPVMAKEDAAAHALFLEGTTLLAYNVAWLCLSQNIAIGDRLSFDDVCNMGRNLYNLLIGSQLHQGGAARTETDVTPSSNLMGVFSHGTTHHHLGSAAGTEFVRSFKLPSPIKLADKLKRKLGSQVASPEWEVVESGDWVEAA